MRFSTIECMRAVAAFVLLGSAPLKADVFLILNPTSVALHPGDSFSVNVGITGLAGTTVGAYDIDVLFDPAKVRLAAPGFVDFGSFLGYPFSITDVRCCPQPPVHSPTLVNLAELNFAEVALYDPLILDALQPDGGFNLATLWFTALDVPAGQRFASFSFGGSSVADAIGQPVPITTVPEPDSAALLMAVAALAWLGCLGRRRAHLEKDSRVP